MPDSINHGMYLLVFNGTLNTFSGVSTHATSMIVVSSIVKQLIDRVNMRSATEKLPGLSWNIPIFEMPDLRAEEYPILCCWQSSRPRRLKCGKRDEHAQLPAHFNVVQPVTSIVLSIVLINPFHLSSSDKRRRHQLQIDCSTSHM